MIFNKSKDVFVDSNMNIKYEIHCDHTTVWIFSEVVPNIVPNIDVNVGLRHQVHLLQKIKVV